MLAFLGAFADGSLQPDMRSSAPLDGGAARGPSPGRVTEVVGSTFEQLVRNWVPAVPPLSVPGTHQPRVRQQARGRRWTFMFFHSRTCPACTEAMPTIEQLASDLKDYAFNKTDDEEEPERPLLHVARVEKPFNDFAYRGLMITHYPTAYLFAVDDEASDDDAGGGGGGGGGGGMRAFAYADYSGENSPHDHHHASHDHWSMHKLRHFIQEVVGIAEHPPAKAQLPSPPPTTTTTTTATTAATASVDGKKRGAGWSHAQQQLVVLSNKLSDPVLMGADRLALEQQVRALQRAEQAGWTAAELEKLKRDGYL
jgi:hypothetical protein